MPEFTDQLNRKVHLQSKPRKIISLVPSQTELLFDLGLESEVIGITKFCVHPLQWFQTKTRVGGTKNPDLDKISSLEPDLIIANKEENVKEQVDVIAEQFPVWVSDVNTLEEALSMIRSLGEMTDSKQAADKIISVISGQFENTNPAKLKACYLIWQEPYMTVGGDTFISDMMEYAGFENVFTQQSRYPEITVDDIKTSGAGYLLLSSEPFPFKEDHVRHLQALLPGIKILLVDGEMFSWYGSRLVKAAAYFKQLRNYL